MANDNIFDTIGIDKNTKFGLEIEAEDIKKSKLRGKYDKKIWKLSSDASLKLFNNIELSSIPFTDEETTYKEINTVCNLLKDNNANVDGNSSLQIHYDAEILKGSFISIINFYKMWCAFENIIYRYSYGEKLRIRDTLQEYSKMVSRTFYEANTNGILFNNYDVEFENGMLKRNIINYSKIIGSLKSYGFSFRYYSDFGMYYLKTIEFRTMNGTLELQVIKNYLKFFHSFLKFCSDEYNSEYISYLYSCTDLYENNIENTMLIDEEKAEKLVDLIYSSEEDKNNFMKLYLKK